MSILKPNLCIVYTTLYAKFDDSTSYNTYDCRVHSGGHGSMGSACDPEGSLMTLSVCHINLHKVIICNVHLYWFLKYYLNINHKIISKNRSKLVVIKLIIK